MAVIRCDGSGKSQGQNFANNYGLCFGRLKSLARRLKDNEGKLKKYDDTIQEQLRKGTIVEAKEQLDPVYYIPTPLKSTAKLRVVYDAITKANKENSSLNES